MIKKAKKRPILKQRIKTILCKEHIYICAFGGNMNPDLLTNQIMEEIKKGKK